MATTERLTEREGRARACRHLRQVIGGVPGAVCWDRDHHLQGHVQLGHLELVLIAPRDEGHEPVVLTAADWDEACHTAGPCGAEIVRERAIRDAAALAERAG